MVQIAFGHGQGILRGAMAAMTSMLGQPTCSGIWKLLEQPTTECSQNVPLLLCGVCLFAQKRLTLREFNSLVHQDSTRIIFCSQWDVFRFRPLHQIRVFSSPYRNFVFVCGSASPKRFGIFSMSSHTARVSSFTR
jgi:hypothetical protein